MKQADRNLSSNLMAVIHAECREIYARTQGI